MSQFIEGRTKTFRAGEALASNRLVILSSGTVIYADATHKPIGVTRNAAANGEPVAIDLMNLQGTVKIEASAAITAGASVYGTADGKIDDADPGSGVIVGKAMEAAADAGDLIEVLPRASAAF
ncbi:MAG TPA: DUF2190 family protein [Candidatus Sumerlaeota bacterium]|nr:DUF2190 family protein [Candidatus Sumerlaeota bacterium]HOR28371.1 DUF2190 family protein [Candidatus Sumerlaeota bacterium]